MDRVIEDLARSLAAPCATTWFKISGIRDPSIGIYRSKVVEFMYTFRSIIFEHYPKIDQSMVLRDYAMKGLEKAIREVNSGNNKEVERRYVYYTQYN